jgi:glycosyltransferase involved in cell wall biosynthesis
VKGPDRFVELATRHTGDAGFVLIGAGSYEAELRNRVAERGLSSRVAFLGHVDDAVAWIRELDLVAVPSRHEGFPMVLLEAATCGVPAVAFDVGGVREVLDGAPREWLIDDGCLEAFEEAMTRLLDRRAESKDAAKRWAAQVRARYGLAAVVDAYSSVYMNAASKRLRLARQSRQDNRSGR